MTFQARSVRWEMIVPIVLLIVGLAAVVSTVDVLTFVRPNVNTAPAATTNSATNSAYSLADLDAIGISHVNGVVTSVGNEEEEILLKALPMRWSMEENSYTAPSGTTAVVLEDEPLLQVAASVALRLLGIKVIGVYPSCEAFQAAPVVANIYVLDNYMAGEMRAPDCAGVIYAVNPTAIVVLNSASNPDDPFLHRNESYSLRQWVQRAGFDASQVTGVEKDLFMQALGKAIRIILGG